METWAFALPTIDVPFTGTGDLLSSLCTAWFGIAQSVDHTSNSMPPLAWAVSKALLTVQQILLRTYVYMLEEESRPGTDNASLPANTAASAKARALRRRELRIVRERALITDGGEGWKGNVVHWEAE